MTKIITVKELSVVLLFIIGALAVLYPLLQVVDMGTTAYMNGGM